MMIQRETSRTADPADDILRDLRQCEEVTEDVRAHDDQHDHAGALGRMP